MEDFLLRAKSMLATESQWSRVHAVLGGGEADVDSLASVLGYAYFLSQRVPSDCVCLPVLNRCRSEATVPEETLSLLQQAGVHESSLAWREDLDLLQLHESRKLSLTLLSSDVLNRGEADVLALSIVGVIVRPQQQGCGEGASSSTVTVTREILREAPELLASPLTGLLRGALLMESMKKLAKDGRLSSDCEELLGALTQDHRHSAETECQGANMDQILLKELKELSDGDIKVSISTVSVDLEHYSTYPDLVWDLKSFCDRHGYEGLVLVSSSVHEHRCHQLAVYSENKDILSQISCELEEAQNSDLEMEPMDCVLNVLQLYRLRNTSVYIEQIASLVKEFLEQRQRSFLLNSRTSSTEGVAGSAPLSQGSSGITDMYNSDLDPPSAMSVHFPDNAPPEPSEPQPALGEGGAELLSPDSGLATVRSSRSSKESSVFLSDDSPAAEMAGFLHNPALYLPSLCVSGGGHGPPELTLPASSDNFDLFGFDPLYSCNASPPTGGAEVLSGNTEERGSSSLSEFGELSLVDFYTSDEQGESEGSYQPISDSKETSRIPATPLNSLVDGSPLGQGLPRFFPEDIMGKISGTENKESVSSSEPWDDFSSDTKGSTSDDANLWSLIDVEYTAEGGTDTDLGKQIEFKDTGQRGEGHETVDLGDKDGHLNSNYTFLWNMPVIKAIHGVSDWNVDVTRPDQAETHTSQLPGALSPYGNESLEESWQSHTGLNIDTLERCKPMSLCPSADFLSRETLDSPTANVANVSHTTPRGSVHPTVRDNLLWTREESPVCEEEKGSGIHDVCLHFESLTQEDPPINGLRTEDSPASNPGEEQRSATLPSEDNEREACEALGAETLLLEPLQVYTSLTENSAEFPEDFSEDCVVQSTPTYLLQERHQSSHMWNPFVQMTQPTETYDNWNPNLRASDVWNPNMRASDVWNPNMLGNVQVTQTEEKLVQHWAVEKSAFAEKHNLLSPKEASEEDSGRDKIGSSEPDFWDYSAQKGFSEIDDFYPKSLDMWNTTICDDSQSTLTTPDVSDPSGTSDLCRGLSQGTSLESPLQAIPEGMDMWNTTVQEDTQSTITTPDTRDGAGDAGSWETPFENDTKENVAHSESRADICVENERIFNKESSKYSGTAPKEYGSPGSCSETETELSVLGSRNAADAEGSVPVEKSPEVAVSDEKSTHADDPPSHTGEHGALLTGLKKGTSDVLAWETSSAETTRGWNTDFYHSQEFVPGFGAGFKTELPQIGDFDCVRAEEDDVPAVNKQSPQPNVGTMAVSTQMVKSVSEYDNVDTSSMWDQTWSDPNDQPDLPPIIGGQPTTDGAALAQLQAVITRMDVHGREEGTDDSLGTESPVPVFHREVSFKSHTVPGVACPQTGGATPPECETNSDSNDDANLYTAVILRKETKFTSDLVLSRGNAPVSAISDEDGKWSKHSLTESERNMPEGSSVDSEYENEGESVDRTSHHSAFLLLDAGGPSEDSMFSLSQEGATSVISEGGTIHHMSSVEQLENSPSPEGMCLSAWLTAGMSPTDSCPQVEGHLEARQPSSKDTSIVLAAVSLVSLEIGSLEGAKGSPDLLQLGSREDVRSNSDGDSSGLEMDYIIVSGRGAVREDERSSREAHLGPGRITPLNPSHSSESCQVNGGVDSLYQMNTDVDRPDRTSPDMNCDHQINADLNCPCPSNMGVYSPSQTITDVNSQTIAGVNSQTIAGVNSQTITDVNSQMNNGTSSATARDSFSRFKAKEEVYVRSQISLEDSDEEDRSSPATQEWMLLDRREDPDCSPGQSSEVTHRSESDSGRSVREVGSPSACDVVGGTDSFFLHCSSPSHNCVYHKREELAHSLDLRMIQAQANQVKAIEKTMEDQVPEGWRENPAERPIGNQFLDRDGGDTAVEPIANQFLKGRTEDGAGQAMEEQFTESHQKNKAERPMEDLLLESCVGHTAGPVQDQPPQAKMECRTKQPMREKKEGILVELPPCGKPRSPLDDVAMDVPYEEGTMSPDGAENRPVPPSSLDLHGAHPPRKKLAAPPINLSLDQSEGSLLSDDALDTPDDLDINVDDLDTPDEADSLEYTGQGTELEWEETQASNQEAGNEPTEAIPEYTAEEERQDARLWRTVIIGEQEHRIDMKCIEPYQRVVSHGGYYGDLNAIIVFAACFLPDSSRDDYHYIMENLFLYVISTLELMVAEDYMIVYLNGATPRRRMPGLGWLKKCYHMIDRRLRKNLKSFIIVHPSWFIRTVLAVTRPFISSKFSSKIKYVNSLAELRELIPMEQVYIPQSIVKYEEEWGINPYPCTRLDEELMEASEASTLNSFLYGPESAPDQPEADTAPCSSLS